MSAISISGARIASPKIIHPVARRSPPEPPRYADFDRWAELVFKLDEVCLQLGRASEGWSSVFPGQVITRTEAQNLLDRYPTAKLKSMAEEVLAGDERFNGPELHHPWHPDIPSSGGVKRHVISAAMKRLYASFPNASPQTRAFMEMVCDEVDAAHPRVTILESACRALRRSCLKPPSIATVLAAIAEQREKWFDKLSVADADDNTGLSPPEYWRRELEAYVNELKGA